MRPLELLSPAKDKETALAAFNHGADAVYIGPQNFGARVKAGNKTSDIEAVVNYAHRFGGKVYCTVNTIFFDHEKEQVYRLITDLWNVGVDAIIIQDTGILELGLPPMCFHMSTQANNVTLEQIKFWENTGISRVILARELTLDEIKTIRSQTTIELEAFIQGALCVSYSGNCYMSADINHRSANRGNCAQPCRLPYDLLLPDGKALLRQKHLLSTKDLAVGNLLFDLIESGITSFKIEGRLKDIAYVKNITAYYHLLLEQYISRHHEFCRSSYGITTLGFEPNPQRTFSRPSTTYFYQGRNQQVTYPHTPKSLGQLVGKIVWVKDNLVKISGNVSLTNGDGICYLTDNQIEGALVVGKSNQLIKLSNTRGLKEGMPIYRNYDKSFIDLVDKSNHPRKIAIDWEIDFSSSSIIVTARCELAVVSKKFDYPIIPAQNQELALINWKTQFSKLGDTNVFLQNIKIQGEIIPHLQIREINNLRRQMINRLTDEIRSRHIASRPVSIIQTVNYHTKDLDYRWNVANAEAKKFYLKRGVENIENALETQSSDDKERIVMVTKTCILFELNKCKKIIPKAQQLPEPLYIENKFKRYRLLFDCQKCIMMVKTLGKLKT